MNFNFYIAKRYLISRKSHHIINIISGISVIGVMIGTIALIVVLSVFNGFEELVKSLYSSFDPDIKITPVSGKTFRMNDLPVEKIQNHPGVVNFAEVVQENALLKCRGEQTIVVMKGVSDSFLRDNPIGQKLIDGKMILQEKNINYSIMGYLVAYNLGIRLFDFTDPVAVYVPRRDIGQGGVFNQPFNLGQVIPSAVFAIQQEIDSRFILVPIELARNLLEYDHNELTAIEIRLKTDTSLDDIKRELQNQAGDSFKVQDRYQQQELLYKIMKSEKWAIFFILTFILIMAAFNMVGSLSMLILDKRKDIAILFGMGTTARQIRKIFITEGIMISLLGAIAGLIGGFILCFLQIRFGLIRLGETGSFIVPYYPVAMKWIDFVWVFLTVVTIGLLAAWIPVRQVSMKYLMHRVSEFTKSN